jgi:DNA-binding transcriptional LysR family regulator
VSFRRGQLEYFVAVAEEGQMTRAARRLHIAQPALSQAIGQLEGELGIKLLERHPRGVTLTAAGRTFYEKARLAVEASDEAVHTARSLARAQQGTIEFGFVGSPPGLDSPHQLEAFSRAYPDIDIRYTELPFPTPDTAMWLGDVDVAACHAPPRHPEVWSHALRSEPRVLLTPRRHPLAERAELLVADVLDETFIHLHPSVDERWAGFWSLDDHRGGPAARVTSDRAGNPQEVLAALAVRDAVTTVPASVAAVVSSVVSELAAVPIRDAAPAQIVLVGHRRERNPLVASLASFAGAAVMPAAEQDAGA